MKYLALTPFGATEIERCQDGYVETRFWDGPFGQIRETYARRWLQAEGWLDLARGKAGEQIFKLGVDSPFFRASMAELEKIYE